MSNPNPPAPSFRARRLWWIGLLALAGYGFFLARHTAVVAGGSDSSGYLNSARLLASGQLLTDLRAPEEFGPREKLDPMHFLPQGFFALTEPGRLTPTYPTGLPLHFALAGKLFGWRAGPLVVMLGAALAAVVLCYAVARELGVGPELAVAGAVMLAAFPVFIFTSVQPLSDTLATVWTLAAMFTALRAREQRWQAGACGLAFAMAVLVRPTNLLLAPALLVLLGLEWRRLALFVAGGAPGAAWLAFYNHRLYGSVLSSGYGDVFEAFSWSYGAPTGWHFGKWLALLLPTPLLALAVCGWLDLARREVLALALAFLAITGLYAFYEVSHEVWWCLRFILPVVPVLIFGGLLGVEVIVRRLAEARRGTFRVAAAVVLALWALAASAYWAPRLSVLLMKQFENAYADGSLAARARLPRDAVVVSFAFSGSLYFYTQFPVMRWDQIDPPVFGKYAALAQQAGRPVCAVLFESEEKEAFRKCPGGWTKLATIGNVGLWQLAMPKTKS